MQHNIATLSQDIIDSIYFVSPVEVHEEPKKYAQLLADILLGCYGDDYPGASIDAAANLRDIESGVQKTVFWAITDEERDKEKFGSSSIVDASHEFGPGYGELVKSGSLGAGNAKYGYARFIQEWEAGRSNLDIFDALGATVRNCTERPGKNGTTVKAGVGVRIMYLKYFKFEQWGVAPWYLLPDDSDGSYEMLDLIFRFRNPGEAHKFLQEKTVALEGEKNRSLLDKFTLFNYQTRPKYSEAAGDHELAGWKLTRPTYKPDRNLQLLVHSNNNNTFQAEFNKLSSGTAHCGAKAVILPLVPDTIPSQRLLEKDGWVLTSFIPGRMISDEEQPYQGMWVKLNSERPIIVPFYLQKDGNDNLSPNWYVEWVSQTINALDASRQKP